MAEGRISFEECFTAYATFGDKKSTGITLSQSDKWMKQAKLFGKKLTTTDTAVCFKKYRILKMDYKAYLTFLQDLAKTKGANMDDWINKMIEAKNPNVSFKEVKSETVDRLTDATKYTGMHKERFDESGKGKGIEGREYLTDEKGYVTGYKLDETYDGSHPTS